MMALLVLAVAVTMLLLGAGVYLVVPRLAHRAFEHGEYRRAALLYRIARRFAIRAETRGAYDVSLAGCLLARSDWDGALEELDRIDALVLGASARAAWLNNRAYAHARASANPSKALAEADEAVKLRPDVPGFRHTRAVALLALGRLDDAIVELEDVWNQLEEEAPPLLEAERCYDLGLAWRKKGEQDYARDYFQRAQTVAPGSSWAERAARESGGEA
jgi:tetratricopeptide (TPR) repeat protein